ncbi:hypothetical protein DFH08DRAFT_952733 [Mycena albidolilacea]|uniref:Uncharacterized protein n=1 Tax=Mycena albidolilacea TaxID=1033008 RepID=A0AAD7EYS6_9AGAR|nr:hypothetical protein DFH08DRAFT_952733 [Mycena albidolilacea]
MSYRPLRLEESSLVFFPPQTRRGGELREPTVVQVMIKMEPQSRFPTREEVAAYCDAQEEITTAVETLLVEDLFIPLQKRIEIEGDGYVLIGEKKEWVYGQRLVLMWGDEVVRAAANKWVFRFRLCGGKKTSIDGRETY